VLALLRTRRWLGFTALVITAILAFGLLSRWQWHRAEEKRVQRAAMESAQLAVAVNLPAGAAADAVRPWQRVTVSGEYRPDSELVVRKRPLNGANGYWVLAPLDTSDGRTVWISRGWIPASGPATELPTLPPSPAGPIRVEGSWRQFEDVPAADQAGLPAGMLAGVDPDALPGGTDVDGYLQALEADDPALTALPVPTIDEGQNISYAVQWLLFALVAIGGWLVFLRREAIEDARRATASSAPPG
jgi:cytochrome oxidase assembly protein ShyY1